MAQRTQRTSDQDVRLGADGVSCGNVNRTKLRRYYRRVVQADSPMGELLLSLLAVAFPAADGCLCVRAGGLGGWLAHGADPLPDRSLTGRACLIVVQAFPIGWVWGGRLAQVLVRIVTE